MLIEYSEECKLELANDQEASRDKRLRLHEDLAFANQRVSSSYVREKRAGKIYHCNRLAKVLGIELGVIEPGSKDTGTWRLFARWPLKLPWRFGRVLTGRVTMQNLFPSLPKLALRPQNTIPPGSEIIKACEGSDLTSLQEILKTKRAHPNDCTPNGLTVFRVGKAGMRSSQYDDRN